MKNRAGLGLFALTFGIVWCFGSGPSYGLPGQSIDEAKTWMQGHPTLRADTREGLRIHRADIPSRRFTFQASVFPIGGLRSTSDNSVWPSRRPGANIIRREELVLVDYDKPVTVERMEESLRVIYGADIYADYRRSELLNSYAPSRGNARGEVRLGNLYAYWIETIPDASGLPTIGKLNVVLPEDVDRLSSYLDR